MGLIGCAALLQMNWTLHRVTDCQHEEVIRFALISLSRRGIYLLQRLLLQQGKKSKFVFNGRSSLSFSHLPQSWTAPPSPQETDNGKNTFMERRFHCRGEGLERQSATQTYWSNSVLSSLYLYLQTIIKRSYYLLHQDFAAPSPTV